MASAYEDEARAEAFIRAWKHQPGSERADAQSFLNELCDLIGAERPHAARARGVPDLDYGFERPVHFRFEDGSTAPGRIDLYKKGAFVLEAKQSFKRRSGGETFEQLPLELRGGVAALERPRARPKPPPNWDALMRAAKHQAVDYARCLDEWPPFIVVVDVGHVIELYADFSGQGKNYAQFPTRTEFRIAMDDLRDPTVRDRLRLVWDDPFSLDPSAKAAAVTQEIAALLAHMTRSLEARAKLTEPVQKAEYAYKVSKFLMRCIFAMFAERMGLLPAAGFQRLIALYKDRPERFHLAADDFFRTMDEGGHATAIQEDIRKFNGGLFREAVTVEITGDELAYLEVAASKDWTNVEPAIFGTLLEQIAS